MRWMGVFFVLISHGAFCATCPDGFIAADLPAHISLNARCDSGVVDLGIVASQCDSGAALCVPELACSGMREIMAGDGNSATLYVAAHTTPAINITVDGATCYANLVSGTQAGAIHVKTDETMVYHTADLRRCINISADAVPNVSVPENNSVSWGAKIDAIDLVGMAYCSSSTGNIGSAKAALVVSDTMADNKYCWCRIVSPAVSSWVLAAVHPLASDCETSCAKTCADAFASNASFRGAIIAGMK